MKLTTYIFLLSFFLSTSNSFGQVISAAARAAVSDAAVDPFANVFQKWTPMMQKLFQQINNEKDYIEYDVGTAVGSPYENQGYLPGAVYYEEDHLGAFYYRYNAYNQEIELKKTLLPEEKQKALVKDPKVKLITTDGTIQFLSTTSIKGTLEEHYIKLIFNGTTYKLYQKLVIKFTEGRPAANSMVNPIPSRFTNYDSYYYKKKESIIEEIPQKKSKFLKLFPEKATLLKDYFKTTDLNFESKQDLITLFRFIEKNDL